MLKLNETPVRTSKNFNINSIELEDVEFPKIVRNFENVKIINENSNLKIETNVENSKKLVYGLGDIFTNQVLQGANRTIKLTTYGKLKEETIIEFTFDEKNKNLIDNIELNLNENSNSTIIIKYLSDEKVNAYHNGIIKVLAKENSNVNIIIVNLLNTNSNNFISMENELKANSKVNYTIVDFGGKNSITNYYSNVEGENANNNLNAIYLGKENQLFDLNYIVELRGKKTNTNIEVQGALKDKAKKHFKGTIDFKKGAKKAIGNENENCMLLSDSAKSLALPMLLCSEEDIEGNHSSSAGKIGEKELFYIMSRGFEIKEAMKLMVRAKFNNILENIINKELKEQILEEIDKKLN